MASGGGVGTRARGLLGARVAMFVFRYPTEMAFAGAMKIDSVGPGTASGTVRVPKKEAKPSPDAKALLDEAHTRMVRVVASQPTDDRAWLLAGRMCRLEHEPAVDASCEPLLAHCVAFPACKQEHDFVVRELRPRGCTRVGVDPNIELRGASEAASGVSFDGKNYKLDAAVFLEAKDIERVVEASAPHAFALPSSTARAGYEWEPVVRLELTLDAATRAGKAYATLASRDATILFLKDGNPIGAMSAIGPWDADVYPFFQMQNVPIDRVCVNVSP